MSRKWKCGRKLPGRLGIVVSETRMPINRLVSNYCENNDNWIPLRENFRLVIQGKKNLRRYIEILESAWGLPIETIRTLYREDKGREVPQQEILGFVDWYSAKRKGITIEEQRRRQIQTAELLRSLH